MTFRALLLLPMLAMAGCTSTLQPTPADSPARVANAPYVPDSGSVALRCGALIDGISAEPRQNVTVIIRAGRITGLGDKAPGDLPLLDLPGYTCLPGLIDMHVHIAERAEDWADLRVYLARTREQQLSLARAHAAATLNAGFTTVRNLGNYLSWIDRDLRDAINRGEALGPRLQVTGFYLTIPGGGGDLRIPGVPEADVPALLRGGVSRGPEQFRRNAQRAVEGGADLLKVIASGAVLAYGGVPGEPEMTPAEIAAVVQVAHANGLKVAAHAHGARSIREAILAGVDTIEHASLIDDEGIELARSRDVALVMDVYNGDYIDSEGRREHWPAEFLQKNIETTEAQRQNFTRAHAAGAPIVFGTDAGVYPHGQNARQFLIMVQRGMRPMEAIQAATSGAARYLGWSDRVGQLSPGRFGDLIAVRGDPLDDIRRLEDVAVVIKGGLVFKAPASGPAGRPTARASP